MINSKISTFIFIVFFPLISISQTVLKMKNENGIFKVPCKINGLDLEFIFDTGATDVSISLTEAAFMLKNGYIDEKDLKGTEQYKIANGELANGTKLIIREIEFAGFKLKNIEASIMHNLTAPLLLGQSAIRKLGKIQLDPENNTLTILNGKGTYDYSNYIYWEKKINWLTWDEMVKLNAKNPKKIFIDFYTSWCGWCKVMDKNTFEDSIVAGLMMKDFYCVKFDAERRDSIQFLNKTWKFIPGGRSGIHELAAYFMQNQASYPTFCVLTSDFKLITPLKGYIAVPQFEPIISFLGQDFWKPETGKNMEAYKATYVSPRTTPWVDPRQAPGAH